MKTKRTPPLPKASAYDRPSGGMPRPYPVTRKRKTAGWLRGRRPETQPWRRGRIRPSTCRDLADEA